MIEYKDIDKLFVDNSREEVLGILLDIVNGLYTIDRLKKDIKDYKMMDQG